MFYLCPIVSNPYIPLLLFGLKYRLARLFVLMFASSTSSQFTVIRGCSEYESNRIGFESRDFVSCACLAKRWNSRFRDLNGLDNFICYIYSTMLHVYTDAKVFYMSRMNACVVASLVDGSVAPEAFTLQVQRHTRRAVDDVYYTQLLWTFSLLLKCVDSLSVHSSVLTWTRTHIVWLLCWYINLA